MNTSTSEACRLLRRPICGQCDGLACHQTDLAAAGQVVNHNLRTVKRVDERRQRVGRGVGARGAREALRRGEIGRRRALGQRSRCRRGIAGRARSGRR
eukprot:6185009-Pleurochrysis_carterae.AAC.2